jgi:hypothetical protein
MDGRGDISASNAADALGVGYNVGDVYVLSREAGLPLPNSDGDFEAQQFDRAKKLFRDIQGKSIAKRYIELLLRSKLPPSFEAGVCVLKSVSMVSTGERHTAGPLCPHLRGRLTAGNLCPDASPVLLGRLPLEFEHSAMMGQI